jgi:AcrR family transcriptional regulator
VAAGRELLEAGGLDAVTMEAIADRVGVRAPSLYKRFANRGEVVAAVGASVLEELRMELEPADGLEPDDALRVVATSFRTYALRHPHAYELVFMRLPSDSRPDPGLVGAAAAPLLELTERLVGPERALGAARLVTAFATGFVSMELSRAFRLGGDVDEAYRYGVDVLVDALIADGSTAVSRSGAGSS